jgi:hypothetical protein
MIARAEAVVDDLVLVGVVEVCGGCRHDADRSTLK